MRPSDLFRGVPAVAGALAGAALAGLYGAPAGALLAVMGAEVFRSQRFKSELAAHLTDPAASPAPAGEPESGAALLAGMAAAEARRLGVPPEAAVQAFRGRSELPPRVAAWMVRALQSACSDRNADLSFPLLAAAFDARASRGLRRAASEVFFSLLRMAQADLDSGQELSTSARLAALGCPEATVREARKSFFPEYRDPWDILGLPPGSDKDEVRKAWRRLSRRYRPDRPSGDAQKFREAREAYDRIRGG